jgi:DNA polymerase III delta subunit
LEQEKASESWPQNLLLWAPDFQFLEGASRSWCAQWSEEGGGETVLLAPGLAPGTFLGEVNSLPLWSSRRAVVLRHAQEASDSLLNELSKYLDRPSPTTALLVEYQGDLGDRKLPAAWKEVSGKVPTRDCSPRNLRGFVQHRLRREDFTISPVALEGLMEWAAGDPSLLASALDLLILYKFQEKRILPEDLAGLLGAGGTPSLWDLQDAFLRGDKGAFAALCEGVRRDADAAPLLFVGMLAKQLRALLLLFAHEARGKRRSEVTFKEVGLGGAFPLKKLLDVSGRWDEGRARRALGALCDADLALKGEKGAPWDILQRALTKLM